MIVDNECGAGHESAGEIIEVGEGVTRWKVGDRVAIEAGVPCGKAVCNACRTGRYNACRPGSYTPWSSPLNTTDRPERSLLLDSAISWYFDEIPCAS